MLWHIVCLWSFHLKGHDGLHSLGKDLCATSIWVVL